MIAIVMLLLLMIIVMTRHTKQCGFCAYHMYEIYEPLSYCKYPKVLKSTGPSFDDDVVDDDDDDDDDVVDDDVNADDIAGPKNVNWPQPGPVASSWHRTSCVCIWTDYIETSSNNIVIIILVPVISLYLYVEKLPEKNKDFQRLPRFF